MGFASLYPSYKLLMLQIADVASSVNCEERSDDAIQLSAWGAMDCFASLAMTMWSIRCDKAARRANQPKPVQPFAQKYFASSRRANQKYNSARLTRMRGGSRSSRTCGGMRWTRRLRLTSVADADGEVVWFWRPDAGVKFVRSTLLTGDGGKKAGHRGEREVSRKPSRGESRVVPASPVVIPPCAFLCTMCGTGGHGCQPAPGFPCALFSKRVESDLKTRAHRAARTRTRIFEAV